MKYFSMFSGIGGFELGIQRAFNNRPTGQEEQADSLDKDSSYSTSQHSRQSATCIGYSEIDKYAIKVYERNFNGHRNYGDATAINERELPDFDLLVGGFPCQAFSIAGKRAGFDETRGTLFFDIARILAHKRPRHLVLENVKGLLSHDSGKTFQTILGVLADLGYRVEWQVLNSKDFGVPQNRERVYIVGHLGGDCGREVFPISGNGRKANELPRHVSNTLTRRYEGAQTIGTYIGEGQFEAQEAEPSEQSLQQEGNQSDHSDSRGGQTYPTVPRIRRLTPLECERLQGFPDNWTKYGAGEEPMSDTQRYKMCGNAVTVNVVEAVMRGLA